MSYDHYGLQFALNASPGEIKVKLAELAKKNHIARIGAADRKMLVRLQEIKAELREKKEAARRERFPK